MDFRFIVAFVISIVSCASLQNSGMCLTVTICMKVSVPYTTFVWDEETQTYRTEKFPADITLNSCCGGYLQHYTSCLPHFCSSLCINGICAAYENCSCCKGYNKATKNRYVCYPLCSKQCINGRCSAPENCQCYRGYIKNSKNPYQCDPICNSRTCINGNCVAPDFCKCNLGYKKDSENKCIPICTNCTNGDCVSPDTCICNEGYENVTGECILATSLHCNNTDCSKNCTKDQCESGATFAVSKVTITSMKILLPTVIAGVLVLFLVVFLLKRRNSKRASSSSQHSEFVIENELYIPMVN